MPNLSNGKTLIGYTGASTSYTAVVAGEVVVKLWGGAGGGNASNVTTAPGGGGGFTTLAIPVAAGDVIKLEVGQGGQVGSIASGASGSYTGTGGVGGWPDGGNGASTIYGDHPGGGGSTRVYKNNVLVGVAGAGGGAGFQVSTRQAGAGGGLAGQDGTQTLNGTGGACTGGTQTAGGVNGAFPASVAPFYTGASLQGGHGYGSGFDRFIDGHDDFGPGGGGGYFGGAGGGKAGGYMQGGSGGSGYIAAGLVGSTTQGNRDVPAGTGDHDYTAGVAVGGSNATPGSPTTGGNGAAVLDFAPLVGSLVSGKSTAVYQGNGVVYNVPRTGRLNVKLWGGGGGGLILPNTASPGGAGGYTTVALNVTAGDNIRVEVGQGGQVGTLDNPAAAQGSWLGTGGVGGWPDGGNGASNQNAIAAGGGGSTRIYINGVLQAVAGAGGGAGATVANRQAGAGGGLTGQDGTETLDGVGATGNVSGATQTVGGINSVFPSSPVPFYTGGSLQGGHGYAVGQTNATDNVDAGGSGGGGGFFGGGGAGKGGSYVQGASGGSGYVKSGLVGSTTQGNRGVPANSTDSDLPAGVAVGGTNNTPKSPLPGGNGVVVFDYNDLTTIFSGQTFTVPYTRAAETYTVQADGVITLEAWGGAGAGGTFFSATTAVGSVGGAGGYILMKVPVKAGDVIKFEAAQGGQKGTASADTGPGTSGGLGGWPDGGSAGLPGTINPHPAFGGGGGSTRIYKNGVLIGVAAGGAGSYGFKGGNPGGTLDAPLTVISPTGLSAATQYVGGACTVNGGGTSRNFGQGQSILTSPTGTGGNGFANAADNVTPSNGAGCGAGGGYWGGGCFYVAGDTSAAGGGSSFIHPDYFYGSNWAPGVAGTPNNGIGANRPAAVSVGGAVTTTTTLSGCGVGGDGAIWMSHAPAVTAGAVPNSITLGVERLMRSYTADRAGTITAKLWGGAGAGGTYFATTAAGRKGGAGGYTEVQIPVVIGDVISVEVGQGGQKPWSSLGTADGANAGLSAANKPLYPGAGGWPDGGSGGRHAASPWGGFGGGGGSTRIYKNGVLVGVAAGGGASTGLFYGGSGGATVGGQSADSSFCGTGGTQSAGGTADGASLKGAPGYVTNAMAIETTSGAGGGGGYFGGGSNNGRTVAGYGSGGGGSAYMDPSLIASTTSGARDTGIPYDGSGAVRPAGVAVGGSVSSAANTTAALAAMTAGGDGAAMLTFPQPLNDGVAVTSTYSGSAATYVVSADGVLNLEAWGGGGGGGFCATQDFGDGWGGGGGNISGNFNVFKGDIIKVEVGQGGRGGVVSTAGGLGGWPDGGNGGRSVAVGGGWGGGGGSTRIYLNDKLISVAGAGGGMIMGGQGGVGGGTTGGTGSNAGGGTGGTQTSPGVASGGSSNAGFLQGGNGYVTGETNTTADDTTGPGGGGGWFGGAGGIVAARAAANAGGGSSYVATVGINVATVSATAQNPNDSGHKPAGVGVGGKNNRVAAAGSVSFPGGDGAAYLKLVASTDQATKVFKATGADQTWIAPSFGTLRVKGYAAGGGGGAGGTIDSTHPAGWGGPGGYIEFTINVAINDVITIEVGKGGVPGTTASGAFGGWPDGGNSGRFVSTIFGGSGGGSTRIYKNGVLQGIAGAGGGGVGVTSGGAGGGLVGDTGNALNSGTGGTQTAGGDTPQHQTATPGISFHGGNGYATNIATADDLSGGGGGGGFFGGGGGYAAGVRGIPGGGGGSSHFGPDAFNTSTQMGTTGNGTPFQSPVLVPLIAYGGIGTNAPATPASGSDGVVVFYFTPVDGSVASGGIPTILMQAPTGVAASSVFGSLGNPVVMTEPSAGVKVGVPIGGFTTEIDMTAPSATPAAASNWTFAPIGIVTMVMNLVGTPPTEAIINVSVSDADITLLMDTTTEVHASVFVDKLLLPLIVRMTNPRAFILGFANGDLGTDINLTAVTAGAETGPEAPAVLDSIITVSQVVDGSATGQAIGFPFELTFSGNNPPRWFTIVSLNGDQLRAVPQSGAPIVSTDPIPQIDMQLPLTAYAEPGIEVFADINATIDMLSNLGATVGGSALAIVHPANSSNFFPDLYVARVLMVPAITPQVEGAADFTTFTQPVTVIMVEPSAIATHGAFVLSTILPARIVMKTVQAVGFAGNFALGIGDMDDLVIVMTEVSAFSPVSAQDFADPILVDYVDGYVDAPLPPGIARIKWKRSQTPGAQPLTLAEREVALNEYDGILYSRDGQGNVRATPYLGFGKGRFVPAGGADGQVLGVDLEWKSPPTGEGSSRLILPPSGSRFLLANNFTGASVATLENVGAGNFPVHYRPFFLPKATQLTALSVEQLAGNLDAQGAPVELRLWLGVCEWDPVLSKPTILAASNFLDVADGSGNTRREVPIGVTLSTGWYAAMFGAHSFDQYVPAAPTATWQAWKGGVSIGDDFFPRGEPVGVLPIGADFTTPPQITRYATVQVGDVSDHAFIQATDV